MSDDPKKISQKALSSDDKSPGNNPALVSSYFVHRTEDLVHMVSMIWTIGVLNFLSMMQQLY